jgi:hypothetical protein
MPIKTHLSTLTDSLARSILHEESTSAHSTFAINFAKTIQISPAPKQTVAFSDQLSIETTINREGYSPEETLACYFTKEEYTISKESRRNTIKMIESGVCVNNATHYFRGLENKSREGRRRRQFNQVDALMAVMDEQDAQFHNGMNDPEMIAKFYINCSRHCRDVAEDSGQKDQRAALESFSDEKFAIPPVSHNQQRRLSCRAA